MVVSQEKYLAVLSSFKLNRINNPATKLKNVPEDIIRTIVQARQNGFPVSEISKASGLSKTCIYNIVRKESPTPIPPPRELEIKDAVAPSQNARTIEIKIGSKVHITIPIESLTTELLKSLGELA